VYFQTSPNANTAHTEGTKTPWPSNNRKQPTPVLSPISTSSRMNFSSCRNSTTFRYWAICSLFKLHQLQRSCIVELPIIQLFYDTVSITKVHNIEWHTDNQQTLQEYLKLGYSHFLPHHFNHYSLTILPFSAVYNLANPWYDLDWWQWDWTFWRAQQRKLVQSIS
jgi:hypothetical protein